MQRDGTGARGRENTSALTDPPSSFVGSSSVIEFVSRSSSHLMDYFTLRSQGVASHAEIIQFDGNAYDEVISFIKWIFTVDVGLLDRDVFWQ